MSRIVRTMLWLSIPSFACSGPARSTTGPATAGEHPLRTSAAPSDERWSTVRARCVRARPTGDILLSVVYTFVVLDVLAGDWAHDEVQFQLAENPTRVTNHIRTVGQRCRGRLILRVVPSTGSLHLPDKTAASLIWVATESEAARYATLEATLWTVEGILRAGDTTALDGLLVPGGSIDETFPDATPPPDAPLHLANPWFFAKPNRNSYSRLEQPDDPAAALRDRIRVVNEAFGVDLWLAEHDGHWRIVSISPR